MSTADTSNPSAPPALDAPARRAVYTVVERGGGGRSYWATVGHATVNRDGSLSITLDALPVGGKLLVARPEGV
jgi:hypothetical protein